MYIFLKPKCSQYPLGNSLEEVGQGVGAPARYIKSLQIWFKSLHGKSFKNRGNSLIHAVQNDSFSCSIITMNTIAHAIFQEPLWTPSDGYEHRLKWFKQLGSGVATIQNEHLEHTAFHVNQPANTPLPTPGTPAFQSRIHPTIQNLLNYDSDSSSFDSCSEREDDWLLPASSEVNNALALKSTEHPLNNPEGTDKQENFNLDSISK